MTLARNCEHLLVFYDLEKKTAEKTKPAKGQVSAVLWFLTARNYLAAAIIWELCTENKPNVIRFELKSYTQLSRSF